MTPAMQYERADWDRAFAVNVTELGPSGITVNCIAPGVTHSEAGKLLTPEGSPHRDMLEARAALRAVGQPDELCGALLRPRRVLDHRPGPHRRRRLRDAAVSVPRLVRADAIGLRFEPWRETDMGTDDVQIHEKAA